ncbi:hypothetical protein F3Y22_tig00011079pilonHSYRG00079 [Hibiscus syriacus]|uniref:Protein kinase domain-containing protein n=1 Tax=Hibiscus syriacus TaxID=106335 RepID=A0A6A3C582_HIBSY|nr:hypothetical protein F3Y22_tig00011079pilonHSYRG00079 [Hibiscus syriacus]
MNNFAHEVDKLMESLSPVVSSRKWGTVLKKYQQFNIFRFAQCYEDVTPLNCERCFNSSGEQLKWCIPAMSGWIHLDQCFYRFDHYQFYDKGVNLNYDYVECGLPTGDFNDTYMRQDFQSKLDHVIAEVKEAVMGKGSNFCKKFLTDAEIQLRKCDPGAEGKALYTACYMRGNRPRGGPGHRKQYESKFQWIDQFFNEVTLISGIQHENLVRLLGCSIEGTESLLVYEYMPNLSLDKILFAKNNTKILNWTQRLTIICGLAEASNILIDENLFPKIVDFGLARCVASDKSHVSTTIAGTLGYISPEYLVREQLTEKVDVYAFGVLVLEISTGRKTNIFSEGSSSILYRVWKQYKAALDEPNTCSELYGNTFENLCFPYNKERGEARDKYICSGGCLGVAIDIEPKQVPEQSKN